MLVDSATLGMNVEAAVLYRDGYTLREIGEYQGRSPHSIHNAIRRLGVHARPTGSRKTELRNHLPPLVLDDTPKDGRPHCIRCGYLLEGATNPNAADLCDDCDGELRRGVLYEVDELPADQRARMGY